MNDQKVRLAFYLKQYLMNHIKWGYKLNVKVTGRSFRKRTVIATDATKYSKDLK
jgi:hypothetical protein